MSVLHGSHQGVKIVVNTVPAVPSASACSSLGLCLNFISPKCSTAAVHLYRLIFSASSKPSTTNDFYSNRRNRSICSINISRFVTGDNHNKLGFLRKTERNFMSCFTHNLILSYVLNSRVALIGNAGISTLPRNRLWLLQKNYIRTA